MDSDLISSDADLEAFIDQGHGQCISSLGADRDRENAAAAMLTVAELEVSYVDPAALQRMTHPCYLSRTVEEDNPHRYVVLT